MLSAVEVEAVPDKDVLAQEGGADRSDVDISRAARSGTGLNPKDGR